MEKIAAMSDARLLELQAERDRIKRQPYSDWGFSYEEDIANAVDEIDRLRTVLREIAFNTSSSVPLGLWPIGHYRDQMHRAIGLAARAIEPETEEV